jgi:cytochrome c5
MADDTHSSLIKTPQQLIVVVAAALVVPVAVILLVAALVTSGRHDPGEAGEKAIAARIQPVGTVVIAPGPSTLATPPAAAAPAATPTQAPIVAASIPPAAPATAAKADGKKVYDTACMACHTPGVAGAPKLGDKPNWSPRLAQGANVLYEHAIKGYQGKAGVMPPKGGNMALSDAEVKAAVDFMTASVK